MRTLDTLLSVAPTAPVELLHRIAGQLDRKPPPDVLLVMADALTCLAAEQTERTAVQAVEYRALAAMLTAGITRRVGPAPPALPLADALHRALTELIQAFPTACGRRPPALLRALDVRARARAELGALKPWP